MVNYTTLGFDKVQVPKKVFKVLKKFWEDNKGTEEVEEWYAGNTYTNHVSFSTVVPCCLMLPVIVVFVFAVAFICIMI
jgi:hypothetical protein